MLDKHYLPTFQEQLGMYYYSGKSGSEFHFFI